MQNHQHESQKMINRR